MLIEKIKVKYKKLHDELSEGYYSEASGFTKEEFDQLHGQIWNDCEAEIKTASDYIEPIPRRDLEAEIDALNAWAKTKGFIEVTEA